MTQNLRAVDGKLAAEVFRRGVRYVTPAVIELRGMPWSKTRLSRQGTLTCIVAIEGSALLASIRKAAESEDFDALDALSDVAFTKLMRLGLLRRRLYRSISSIPVLAEFRYGGRSLVRGIFASPRLPLSTGTVAYNGGRLDRERFEVVEYFVPDSQTRLESLILVNHPRLTELEERLLKGVPPSHSEVFVGVQSVAWPAVITAVVTWAVEQVAENVLNDAVDATQDAVANDDGQDAAARQADAAERQADAAERQADAAERAADAAEREADAAEREADAAEREADAAEADEAEADEAAEAAPAAQEEEAQGGEYYVVTPEEADNNEQDDADADADQDANDEGGRLDYERMIRGLAWDRLDATASAHRLLRIRSAMLMRSYRRL